MALAYARSGLVFVRAHRGYARLQARLLRALMAAEHEYFEATPSAEVQQLLAHPPLIPPRSRLDLA